MRQKRTTHTPSPKNTSGFPYISSLVLLPVLLSAVGLFFVFEASSIWSLQQLGDSFYYLKLQLLWVSIGLAVMAILSHVDYRKLYVLSLPLMLVTIGLLILVLMIGYTAGGAQSWIDLGFFNLQPTELAKFATIIYLASWFLVTDRKRFFSFLILLSILMLLILMQPDMGTAMIIFVLSVSIYFLAGKDIHYLLLFIPLSGMAFYFLIKTSPYRFQRLTSFLDPTSDPLGASYHINQILISISNGGLFGKGFGASRQKYLFLPEAHTDSIFAIIGEEFGFIGSFVLIFMYGLLLYVLYLAYAQTKERFGRLMIGGVFSFFALQIIINLGGMVNLMPLTGVTLPFISYGGSHIIPSFALIGIVINISKQIQRVSPTDNKEPPKPKQRKKRE